MLLSAIFRQATTSKLPIATAKIVLRFSNRNLVGHCFLSTSAKQTPVVSRICFSNPCSSEIFRFKNRPILISCKFYSQRLGKETGKQFYEKDANNFTYWCMASVLFMVGMSFLMVPFYRFFCEATGLEGRVGIETDLDKIERMEPVEDRLIRVNFQSHLPAIMSNKWKFKPLQDEIYVRPGETALAFYTATNPTDRPVVGISSYNIQPFDAAYYFNKIQCFCFEEQLLLPGEEVDLPVFFYIDPDYANDPALEYCNNVLLNYTFFEAKKGLKLPSPFDRPESEKKEETNVNNNSVTNVEKL